MCVCICYFNCCIAYKLFDVCFFFKQKTAYEMRISDWSSDVCSSDLVLKPAIRALLISGYAENAGISAELPRLTKPFKQIDLAKSLAEIGRASCRERVCQYV